MSVRNVFIIYLNKGLQNQSMLAVTMDENKCSTHVMGGKAFILIHGHISCIACV